MKVGFRQTDYARLETDPSFFHGFAAEVVKVYRFRFNYMRNALHERDLHVLRSWRFERLKGRRDHQYSIRLNDQWRLILEIEGDAPQKVLVVVGIEDYH